MNLVLGVGRGRGREGRGWMIGLTSMNIDAV